MNPTRRPLDRPLTFPENLTGHATFAAAVDRPTNPVRHRITTTLRWNIASLAPFLADPRHRVSITGHVRCDALGGSLQVSDGNVDLFASTTDGDLVMLYVLQLINVDGTVLVLKGRKDIVHDRAHDLWSDTTTLPFSIRQPDQDEQVMAGTLRLSPAQVAQTVVRMRSQGPFWTSLPTIVAFDRFFLARLASVYLGPIITPNTAITSPQ